MNARREASRHTGIAELTWRVCKFVARIAPMRVCSKALDVGEDAVDADDPYDPTEFVDEDDEF
jgi:hypothetical protein